MQAWPLLVVIAGHSLVEALVYMVPLPMRHQDSRIITNQLEPEAMKHHLLALTHLHHFTRLGIESVVKTQINFI